jgi:hypothetical protein
MLRVRRCRFLRGRFRARRKEEEEEEEEEEKWIFGHGSL